MFHIGRDPLHVSELPWENASRAIEEMVQNGIPMAEAREHIEEMICKNALSFIVSLLAEHPREPRFRN